MGGGRRRKGREKGAKDVGGGGKGLKIPFAATRRGVPSLKVGWGGSNFPKRIHLKKTGAKRGRGGNLTAEERRISSVHSNLCDKERGEAYWKGKQTIITRVPFKRLR